MLEQFRTVVVDGNVSSLLCSVVSFVYSESYIIVVLLLNKLVKLAEIHAETSPAVLLDGL